MDDLDRMLTDDAIVPSSGFCARVMDAVRAAAIEHPPIAFPWLRMLVGPALLVIVLAIVVATAPESATAPAWSTADGVISFGSRMLASDRARSLTIPIAVSLLTLLFASLPVLWPRRRL